MNTVDDDLDLDVLRSIRADMVVDAAVLARVRARLDATPLPRTAEHPLRGRIVAAAVGIVAVGAAATLLVPRTPAHQGGAVSYPPASSPAAPSGSASSTPAEPRTVRQFTTAAATAIALSAPSDMLTTGYRKVTSVATNDYGPGGYHKVNGTLVQVRWLTQTTTTTWVPADPDTKWVQVTTGKLIPTDEAARNYLDSHPDIQTEWTSTPLRAKDGHFNSDTPDWNTPDRTFIDKLSRDPAKLLAQARAWNKRYRLDPSPQNLLTILTIPLTDTWIEDQELRSALFTAIGMVHGIELHPDVTIGNRTGTALRGASLEDPELWSEVIFDPDTYRLVGSHFHQARKGAQDRLDETLWSSELVATAP